MKGKKPVAQKFCKLFTIFASLKPSNMKEFIYNILKGVGMGAANVIPGVSGGTIALLTGIFERLINAIKSFNIKAAKLLFSGKFKEFAKQTDLSFIIAVMLGILIAILTLAKLLEFLFEDYPIMVWAYFFGLILASVYFVGKRISKWSTGVIIFGILGAAIAASIAILTPAKENDSMWYVFLCGIVATCSMILPGLSGSFILILMGNYELVWIESVNNMDFKILIPLVIGAAFGLLAFSYVLSWVFKNFKNQTLSLLTGFILGSLTILWPWKETVSTYIDRHGEVLPLKQKLIFPDPGNPDHYFWFSILLIIVGFASIWVLEITAEKKKDLN